MLLLALHHAPMITHAWQVPHPSNDGQALTDEVQCCRVCHQPLPRH